MRRIWYASKSLEGVWRDFVFALGPYCPCMADTACRQADLTRSHQVLDRAVPTVFSPFRSDQGNQWICHRPRIPPSPFPHLTPPSQGSRTVNGDSPHAAAQDLPKLRAEAAPWPSQKSGPTPPGAQLGRHHVQRKLVLHAVPGEASAAFSGIEGRTSNPFASEPGGGRGQEDIQTSGRLHCFMFHFLSLSQLFFPDPPKPASCRIQSEQQTAPPLGVRSSAERGPQHQLFGP